jgi:polar amino acid transport system substrate-binding protein
MKPCPNFSLVTRLLGLLLLGSLVPRGVAQTIRLEGDVWAPYVMDPATGRKGFMVDIAEQVFLKAGYQVSFKAIPWTRALQDVESGQADGVVGIYFDQAKKMALVVPSEEIGISVNELFTKKEATWTYTGVPSLDTMVLGTVADYDYGELNDYVAEQLRTSSGKVQEVHGNEGFRMNLSKLLANRVTVVVEDAMVVDYISRSLGLANRIKAVGTLESRNKVGIAFHPGPRGPLYAKILSDGIARLRKSGELKAILDPYQVVDWKK